MSTILYPGRVRAPEFPPGLEWINTDHPLSLHELRGKIVLLDFWTYCCINCIHVIPDLARLEAKYPEELVVIGVHSGKFTAEHDTENIREAVLRYEIRHPVVNDRQFEIWNQYAINAWPSFILIDPEGRVVGKHSGENIYDLLNESIRELIREFDAAGTLRRTPAPAFAEGRKHYRTPFAFPGKLAAESSRLYISDSNNNRIVVLSLSDYSVSEVIGSGSKGFKDGDYLDAQFNKPQGIAVDASALYIADTDNHAIRKVDFTKKEVTTIAGTGRQERRLTSAGKGTEVALNSPWDVVLVHNTLYIAMAGSHQLWKLDLETLAIEPYAGSGSEGIIDGPLPQATLAQPSGITTDGQVLYFADSEVSAIRTADLSPSGKVETIVGVGLFDYGDVDGAGPEVRLQHPLGILFYEGALYVADTYNNKVKRIYPKSKYAETIIGTGARGMKDGPASEAELNEPNGLAQADRKLYIADTNNHAIRILDPDTMQVSTLRVKDPEVLMPPTVRQHDPFKGKEVELPVQTVAPGEGEFELSMVFSGGHMLNTEAPLSLRCSSQDDAVVYFSDEWKDRIIRNPTLPLHLPARFNEGETTVSLSLIVYYCEVTREHLCLIQQDRLRVPVQVIRESTRRRAALDITIGEPV